MNDKVYIVLERTFSYNDETYDTEEGGNVVTAYPTFERAQAEVLQRTVEQMADAEYFVGRLGWDVRATLDGAPGLPEVEDFDEAVAAIAALSDEGKVALAGFLDEHFFFVQETVLEAA